MGRSQRTCRADFCGFRHIFSDELTDFTAVAVELFRRRNAVRIGRRFNSGRKNGKFPARWSVGSAYRFYGNDDFRRRTFVKGKNRLRKKLDKCIFLCYNLLYKLAHFCYEIINFL